MAITVQEAQTLFVAYFGRPADYEGLQYWIGSDTQVGTLEQLAQSFFDSPEGQAMYGNTDGNTSIDYTVALNSIYTNMFNRIPETAGYNYWYNELVSGKINIAQAAVAIYRGAQGKDQLIIENKIAAAVKFTEQVGLSDKPSLYYGDAAFASGREFLGTVTDVTDVNSAGFAAQINAAVADAESKGGNTGEGLTFTQGANGAILTNEVNVDFNNAGKFLTSNNDVVDMVKFTSATIQDANSNDNDTAKIVIEGDIGSGHIDGVKLTGIENFEIINATTTMRDGLKLNGSNYAGLEAVNLKGDGYNVGLGFDASTFTYGITINGTENEDIITGGTKGDTINGGAGNDTIKGNEGNDVLTGGNGADTFILGTVKDFGIDRILDFSAEDKISVEGFNPTKLKKFDASTFSTATYKSLDAVLATFGVNGNNKTNANDVVIFSYDGKTYALLAQANGYDETKDTLVEITGANVTSLTESNFGQFTDTRFDYADYTAFSTDAAANKIPKAKATIAKLSAEEAGKLALNNDQLNLIADGGIYAIGTGSGDNTQAVSVTLQTTGSGTDEKGATFDAKLFDSKVGSGVNINMDITGTAKEDTITASKFGGSITAGSGADTISLGAGADTVVFSSKEAADANTITNFTVADDILNFKTTAATGFDGLGTLVTSGALTAAGSTESITAAETKVYIDTLANLTANLQGDGTTAGKVIVAVANDAGNEGIYAATLANSAAATLVKVGTLDGVDLSTLTMANFTAGA